MRVSVGTTRWWVAPPGPDETLASLLARAATLYDCNGEALWNDLAVPGAPSLGPIDAPTTFGLCRLGDVIGLPPANLLRHRVPDAPWRLAPAARQAVCPECMAEDAAAGRTITFRAGWTRAFVPVCPHHKTPLCLPNARGSARAPVESPAPTDADHALVNLIHDFGTTLEQCLHFDASWPTGWKGTAIRARTLVLRACFPERVGASAPCSSVMPSRGIAPWVHGPRHELLPATKNEWEAFRSVADPAVRRAAMWCAAWLTIPYLPDAWRPGWLNWEEIERCEPVARRLL